MVRSLPLPLLLSALPQPQPLPLPLPLPLLLLILPLLLLLLLLLAADATPNTLMQQNIESTLAATHAVAVVNAVAAVVAATVAAVACLLLVPSPMLLTPLFAPPPHATGPAPPLQAAVRGMRVDATPITASRERESAPPPEGAEDRGM